MKAFLTEGFLKAGQNPMNGQIEPDVGHNE